MSSGSSSDITKLLDQALSGDEEARSRFVRLVYDELRVIARSHRRRMSASDTINTTAVVHEAYEKLLGRNIDFNDRRHFFGIASRAMRDVLVDYARSKGAQKRGGDVSTSSLQEGLEVADEPPLRIEEVLSLDAALTELSGFDAMSAQIVELRYFVGLANEEIGVILGVSERTVKRRWTAARAWLYRRLSDDV